MVIGIFIGTYSSVAIAAPLVLFYTNIRGKAAPQIATPVRPAVAKTPKPKRA
jgi:preprotein translocase subunit SecF